MEASTHNSPCSTKDHELKECPKMSCEIIIRTNDHSKGCHLAAMLDFNSIKWPMFTCSEHECVFNPASFIPWFHPVG